MSESYPMNKICPLVSIALGFLVYVNPAIAALESAVKTDSPLIAEVAPSDADVATMRTELAIDDGRWIPSQAEQVPEWYRNKVLKEARELIVKHDYQQALNKLD